MPTILKKNDQTVAGWANYPRVKAQVYEPVSQEETRTMVLGNEQILARGNGKSYGDAALAPVLLSTLRMNKILQFDPENGVIEAESGTLLSDILRIIVPSGWFFQVTPGIKNITVGGAIASDVHGKNHPSAGCFSNHLISFELMTARGEITTCSRTENAALFWQTCGGMGWTGIVLSAKFKLLKIASAWMRQKTLRALNIEQLFQAFEENSHWPYAAGWIDCTSKNWRGALFLAEHTTAAAGEGPLAFIEARKKNVPFFAPSWLLNPLSIQAHNHFYFRKNKEDERLVSLDQYFYPLDALQNWNRFYGRRGFVQYQFCLPESTAFAGIRKVVEAIRQSGEVPFLTVLKRHGDCPTEAVHSFPMKGYSLALDFPRTKGIFTLVKQLDRLVWASGGKIYLTKDACSAPEMGRVNPSAFGDPKFFSLLRKRISV